MFEWWRCSLYQELFTLKCLWFIFTNFLFLFFGWKVYQVLTKITTIPCSMHFITCGNINALLWLSAFQWAWSFHTTLDIEGNSIHSHQHILFWWKPTSFWRSKEKRSSFQQNVRRSKNPGVHLSLNPKITWVCNIL